MSLPSAEWRVSSVFSSPPPPDHTHSRRDALRSWPVEYSPGDVSSARYCTQKTPVTYIANATVIWPNIQDCGFLEEIQKNCVRCEAKNANFFSLFLATWEMEAHKRHHTIERLEAQIHHKSLPKTQQYGSTNIYNALFHSKLL